jgi:hypothetical protein
MNPYFSQEFIFSRELISLKREKILKSLQVPLHSSDTYLDELISDYTLKSLEICNPRASFALYENPSFINKKEMLIEGSNFLLDRIVSSSLKNSTHIAIFVATAGPEVEKMSKKLLSEGNLLEGVLVDILGSEIAEETSRLIYEKIGKEMSLKGMNITNRYSPGYCNWPASDQQKLFLLLDKKTCDIQLTESSLMLPIKSVSGIIGVGAHVKFQAYFCDKCKVGSCIYRDRQ